MGAAATTNGATATHETWRDWVPPGWPQPHDDDLITRDEVLRRAKGLGADINPRTFQSWEAIGILPRPVRRWHDGAVRALYPPWMVDLTVLAHHKRRGGWPPTTIAADLRERVPRVMLVDDLARWEGAPDHLGPALNDLAQRQHELTGARAATAEVRLLDDQGRAVGTFRWTVR